MKDAFCAGEALAARLKRELRTCAFEDVEALKALAEQHSQALEQFADADRELRAVNAEVLERIGERVPRARKTGARVEVGRP